ncbi:hypothetical protein [Azospira restricta]|uniref:Nucleotide-diphospho-sugar transferase n=1 Tax=Azospira restricta TaxID=404405 RepID=A0A974PY14_9RHOO|nr:hypothetical protein [Azospira restricta]QRJ63599.1 nucleotide-diphospho-sugar transferase [Azospira restricta]
METAVLFLVFNRPETTRRVFAAIKAAAPARLYVAADGPRAGRPDDQKRCKEAREIAAAVDWPCSVKTLFREKNLGCRVAVSTAIDWFFECEEQGIILEDDCLPDASWFPFASEMLARFQNEERVMCISASHFHGANHQPEYSYFFSRYNHCWGWATWRRAWQHYDKEMEAWPQLRNTGWLLTMGGGTRLFSHYWSSIFDLAHEGKKIDSWAYRWTFSCWTREGLTVLPARNLVTNIGFGVDATHTTRTSTESGTPGLERIAFPLRHPTAVIRDEWADRWTDRHVFGISALAITRRNIEKIPLVHALMASLSSIRSALRGRP